LRTELGEEKFWRGIALYTSRNAGGLVDVQEFPHAMEGLVAAISRPHSIGESMTEPIPKTKVSIKSSPAGNGNF